MPDTSGLVTTIILDTKISKVENKIPVFNSKLEPLYTTFLHSIQLSEYKVVNVFIVYNVDAWPRNPTNNIKFKNCLFGATSVVKNCDKENYMYNGYEITFDSAGSWGFDNDYARIVRAVDNISLSHADNRTNNFLVLVEGPFIGINKWRFHSAEKTFSINFNKASTRVWIKTLIVVICLLIEKNYFNLNNNENRIKNF